MSNANPHQARAARTQKALQRAGSPDDMRGAVWEAITAALDIVRDPDIDAATRLRAVHAVTQAGGSYLKLVEATEVERRLKALEDARAAQGIAP